MVVNRWNKYAAGMFGKRSHRCIWAQGPRDSQVPSKHYEEQEKSHPAFHHI